MDPRDQQQIHLPFSQVPLSTASSSSSSSTTPSGTTAPEPWTLVRNHVKIPDLFEYSSNHPPLHILPPNHALLQQLPPAERKKYEKTKAKEQARRTREFFRYIQEHAHENLHEDMILPSGSSIGEFCIGYVTSIHSRRMESTQRRRKRQRAANSSTASSASSAVDTQPISHFQQSDPAGLPAQQEGPPAKRVKGGKSKR